MDRRLSHGCFISGYRVIVCGGRDFSDEVLCFRSLDGILSRYGRCEIVSGHAKGADRLGEKYAEANGLECAVFPADWRRYGRGAGLIRNREMLLYAKQAFPVVVAFWNGQSRGAKQMIDIAEQAGAAVHVVRYGNGASRSGSSMRRSSD